MIDKNEKRYSKIVEKVKSMTDDELIKFVESLKSLKESYSDEESYRRQLNVAYMESLRRNDSIEESDDDSFASVEDEADW